MVDVLTPEQRRKCMSRVKNKNTSLELRLRKALWAVGLRYRLNYKLLGKPDLVFIRSKVAVFVDGCFWHGCPVHGQIPKTNDAFWSKKIQKNKDRDEAVNIRLSESGWTVCRFWEHQIKHDLLECVDEITILAKKEK